MTVSIQVAIVIGTVLALSIVLNILLIYYTKLSIMKFVQISDGVVGLKDSIQSFATHLKFVYELEMYYGDETLKALIEHARALSSSFDEYEEFYDLFDLGSEEEEGPEEEAEAEEEEEAYAQTTQEG